MITVRDNIHCNMYIVRVVVCGVEMEKKKLCYVLFIYAARRDFGEGEDGSENTIMCCKCVYI
jgi:hypothetical protein